MTLSEWERYLEDIETELRYQINGTSPQGHLPMVNWKYLPGSLRLTGIHPDPEKEDVFVYDLRVIFLVERVIIKDDTFVTHHLQGTLWIPWIQETGQLDLGELDAFSDLSLLKATV